jgi:hypothetical protein
VDLDNGHVLYDWDGHYLKHPFTLPNQHPIELRNFCPYVPGRPRRIAQEPYIDPNPKIDLAAALKDIVPEQLFVLVYRIVSDYDSNFRASNLICGDYDIMQFGMGIIACFTLNFGAKFEFPNRLFPS